MVFIAGVLLFIFLTQTLDSKTMNPIKAALIFICGYFSLWSVVMGLNYYAHGIPILSNLFNLLTISTALLQFVAAALVFYKIDESGDEYLSYAFWGGVGLAAIFFLAPLLAQSVIIAL